MSGTRASSSPAKSFSTPASRQPSVRDCQLQAELVTDRNGDEELVDLVLELTVVVVARPNTKLPIADHLRVDWVDIDEVPLEQESELKGAASGQDATSNEWSLDCHAGVSGNGRTSHGITVGRSKTLLSESQRKASISDMRRIESRIPSRCRISDVDKALHEELLLRESESRNSTSLLLDMTGTFTDLHGPDHLPRWNRNSKGDNSPWDPLLSRNMKTQFLRDPISRPEYIWTDMSNMLDGTNEYRVMEAESFTSQEPVWKIPLRQREPSTETANISLPPVTPSEWSKDSSNASPEKSFALSPTPQSTSSLKVTKACEHGSGNSLNGNKTTPQSSPKKNVTQQVDEAVETRSDETLKTPDKAKNCQCDVSSSSPSPQNEVIENPREDTPKDDRALPSRSGSALSLTPRAQTEYSISRSPKQETSSTATGTPRNTDSVRKNKTPPSKSPGSQTQETPLESFSIQQFESSPTPSQAVRTEFVRSWIHGAQSREPMEEETFSSDPICSPATTQKSSTVGDDAQVFELDGYPENDDDQRIPPEDVKDDLISLAASPPPSSELDQEERSRAHSEESKDGESRAHNAVNGSYFSTVEAVEAMPYTESVDGSVAIVFPGNVINGVFKIRIVATSDFKSFDEEQWREFILPGFDAQGGGDRGSLLFNFAEGRKSLEFNTQALSWAEIDTGSLYAEFELSRGITLPVRLLDTSTHTLVDGFAIDNTIRSTHTQGIGTNCLAIEYTATCTLNVTRQNFRAERCCFYITLEGGPWGHFEYALDEHDWHVRLDSGPRFSAGDTEIKITCPFSDIGNPFRISWGIDVKALPEKSWVPQIRPVFSDVRELRTSWSQSFGMPYRGRTPIPAIGDVKRDSRVEESPNDVEKAAGGQDENIDHKPNNLETPENEGRNGQNSVTIECGEDVFGGAGNYDRRVRSGKSESDTSSEFIDHPSPWIERDFGMITFLIPLLLIIGGLLRKIIGRKIRHFGHLLRSGSRSISIRTWLKIASLVYLGSLFMGANPIQRFDEIVHRLAVVEKQATVGVILPLLGRENEAVIREQRGLLIVRSSLEDLLQAIEGPQAETLSQGGQKCLSILVQEDEFGRERSGHSNKNADKPTTHQIRDENQNCGLANTVGSKSERSIDLATLSHDASMVSVPATKPAVGQAEHKLQVTIPSMRDRIDRFLGWRDPGEL